MPGDPPVRPPPAPKYATDPQCLCGDSAPREGSPPPRSRRRRQRRRQPPPVPPGSGPAAGGTARPGRSLLGLLGGERRYPSRAGLAHAVVGDLDDRQRAVAVVDDALEGVGLGVIAQPVTK